MTEHINMEIGTTTSHIAIMVSIALFVAYYLINHFKGKVIGTDSEGIAPFLIQKGIAK